MEPLTGEPITRARIAADLRELGLRAADVVLVHTSLRALGWVCGGPVAVVQALLDVLGPGGTLMVPTHSGENSDPKDWVNPPVPASWWPVIRAQLPAYDPAITPSYKVGMLPETVRTWPGAMRSAHPQMSFAAVGPAAHQLLADHELTSQLGEGSPLAGLERAGGKVLLLGTGFGSCTTFHLAEYRVPDPPVFEFGAAITTASGRQWVTFTDVKVDSDDFEALGAAYEQTGDVRTGKVGEADCRLFDARSAVQFAVEWLPANRNRSGAQAGTVPPGG
jgi:aminoglycoside 3-N-acetyltransferase